MSYVIAISTLLGKKCTLVLETTINRSSHQKCSTKKGVLRNFTKFTGKHLWQSLFFTEAAGFRSVTLLKKRLWQRCFPVNFANFLRTPFYKTPLDDCFRINGLHFYLPWVVCVVQIENLGRGSCYTGRPGSTFTESIFKFPSTKGRTNWIPAMLTGTPSLLSQNEKEFVEDIVNLDSNTSWCKVEQKSLFILEPNLATLCNHFFVSRLIRSILGINKVVEMSSQRNVWKHQNKLLKGKRYDQIVETTKSFASFPMRPFDQG